MIGGGKRKGREMLEGRDGRERRERSKAGGTGKKVKKVKSVKYKNSNVIQITKLEVMGNGR